MMRHIFLPLLIIISTITLGQDNRLGHVLNLLKKYYPDGHYLATEYLKVPDHFTRGNPERPMIVNRVHIDLMTPVFPSREMAPSIAEKLRTFRFPKYVNNTSDVMGTQRLGIYSLLDEFNAYYHGTKAAHSFMPWYKSQKNQSPEIWQNFFITIDANMYAYMEFKFFILKYLMFARDNHPEIYDGIVKNSEFKKAFMAIDRNWQKLVNDYTETRKNLAGLLRTRGMEMIEDETTFRISTKTNRRSGTGWRHFREVHAMLARELEKDEYTTMIDTLSR